MDVSAGKQLLSVPGGGLACGCHSAYRRPLLEVSPGAAAGREGELEYKNDSIDGREAEEKAPVAPKSHGTSSLSGQSSALGCMSEVEVKSNRHTTRKQTQRRVNSCCFISMKVLLCLKYSLLM